MRRKYLSDYRTFSLTQVKKVIMRRDYRRRFFEVYEHLGFSRMLFSFKIFLIWLQYYRKWHFENILVKRAFLKTTNGYIIYVLYIIQVCIEYRPQTLILKYPVSVIFKLAKLYLTIFIGDLNLNEVKDK